MKIGDEIEIKITGASNNHGLASRAGCIIFVQGAAIGDVVRVRITDIKKTIAFAEYLSDIERRRPVYSSEEDDDSYGEDYPGYEFEGEEER